MGRSIVIAAVVLTTPLLADLTPDQMSRCCYEYGVNPPFVQDGCGFYGEVSWIYWKPYQDENYWGIETTPADGDPTNIGTIFTQFNGNTQTKDVNYQWDSGFRVGLGYHLPCDKWAIKAKWTYYETDAHRKCTIDPGNITNAFLNGVHIGEFAEDIVSISAEGEGKWRLCFNQIDLYLSREYYVGCSMTLTPYFGLRALWILQDYSIEVFAEDVRNMFDPNTTFTTFSSKMKNDFKSIGLQGGLSSFYEIICGVGIWGDFSIGVLYGCQDSLHKLVALEEQTNPPFPPPINNGSNDAKLEENCLRANLDISLGLEWRMTFNCDKSSLFVKAGWEHHCYFNQNDFLAIEQQPNAQATPQVTPRGGNLYLYGLTVSVGASF